MIFYVKNIFLFYMWFIKLFKEIESVDFFLHLLHAKSRNLDVFRFQRTDRSNDVIRILKTDFNSL